MFRIERLQSTVSFNRQERIDTTDVVLKIDYSVTRNRSTLFGSLDSLNVGLGWWF